MVWSRSWYRGQTLWLGLNFGLDSFGLKILSQELRLDLASSVMFNIEGSRRQRRSARIHSGQQLLSLAAGNQPVVGGE